MPAQVRPTASEAALKAAAAARAAAATAKAAQDDAMAAAAAVADAMLEHRQNGAAAADPREGHELARRQAEDELDAMIANGDFDDGAGEQLGLAGPDDPATYISQVAEDAESGADDEPDLELDAGRIEIDLEEFDDDRDDASAAASAALRRRRRCARGRARSDRRRSRRRR